MPGLQRRLARYPQLYSRVGFAHQYRPLDSTDIPQVLTQYWHQIGLTYDPHLHSDAESVVAIAGITGGNFRLVERLMNQVRPHHDHQQPRHHHTITPSHHHTRSHRSSTRNPSVNRSRQKFEQSHPTRRNNPSIPQTKSRPSASYGTATIQLTG